MKRPVAPLVALAALLALAWAGPAALAQTPPQAPSSPGLAATSDVGAHDPTLIEQGGAMHVFTTGRGLQHLRSDDGGRHGLGPPGGRLFEHGCQALPVPAHRDLDVWAPKVFEHRGRYWLLYSISTFGKKRSAIGLASSPALQGQPWRDEGLVVASSEADDFNAIDPDLLRDDDGRLWMAYGSWWGGLRVTELSPDTLRPIGETRFIARRRGGLEAPTLVRRGPWVYLFASFDHCCKGKDSSYNIRVGRAASVQGPYLDQEGRDMMEGGGTVLERAGGRWIGPGHQDVVGRWLIRHAYDAEDGGKPKLRLDELRWREDGWPQL